MLSWDRGYSSLEIVVWYSVTGWVLLSPWVIVENWGSPIPNPSEAEWVTIAYLGIVSTVLSYVLFARGIEVIGPTATSSYVFLVPVFGVIGGWLLLDEEIGVSMILGFILIVYGVTEVQRENERLSTDS